MFKATSAFAEESSRITGHSSAVLMSMMMSQVSNVDFFIRLYQNHKGAKFFDRFHSRQTEKLEMIMSNESWNTVLLLLKFALFELFSQC